MGWVWVWVGSEGGSTRGAQPARSQRAFPSARPQPCAITACHQAWPVPPKPSFPPSFCGSACRRAASCPRLRPARAAPWWSLQAAAPEANSNGGGQQQQRAPGPQAAVSDRHSRSAGPQDRAPGPTAAVGSSAAPGGAAALAAAPPSRQGAPSAGLSGVCCSDRAVTTINLGTPYPQARNKPYRSSNRNTKVRHPPATFRSSSTCRPSCCVLPCRWGPAGAVTAAAARRPDDARSAQAGRRGGDGTVAAGRLSDGCTPPPYAILLLIPPPFPPPPTHHLTPPAHTRPHAPAACTLPPPAAPPCCAGWAASAA